MLPAPLEESASTARPLKARNWIAIVFAAGLLALGVAACGGQRQDANEPSGNFPVSIVNADFPSKQQLAQSTNLTLGVTNTGNSTIPNLAITIFTSSNASTGASTSTTGTTGTAQNLPQAQGSFSVNVNQPDLAIPFRPVWILEEGYPKFVGQTASAGAEAAQTDTYAFGALPPNQTKQMVWHVTPVMPGTFTVHYQVAAGLQGKAKAVTSDGSAPQGEFVVRISNTPPQTQVNDQGKVVPITPNSIIGQAGSQQQKSELKGQGK